MDLREAIRGRRSVRRFKPAPIPREVLEPVLELALWAPSAGGRQDAYFVVVQGEKREELQRIFRGSMDEIRRNCELEFPGRPEVVEELVTFFTTYGDAPALILAYAGKLADGRDDAMSVAVALQNLFLAAHEVGLGTIWTGLAQVNEEAINAAVGVRGRKLVCITPIGYPEVVPAPSPRRGGAVQWLGF